MSFETIIGQPLAVELAKRWLNRQTTHPLLFYGPEGVGKRTLALGMAKKLNCQKTPASQGGDLAPDSCRCNSCRRIDAGTHPDVRVVGLALQALERDELLSKQQNLRLDTIMNERRRLLQSPVEGPWKIGVLDDVHRLTPDAANVLLKILEEPPDHTAIILLTPFLDRLFQTIVSRCQPVRFRPLADDEMQRCLTGLKVASENQMRLVELALGSPGRAMHMNRDEQIEILEEANTLWDELARVPAYRLTAKQEGRGKASKPGRSDMEDRLRTLLVPAARALRQGDNRAAGAVELIHDALQRLRQNVQPGLVYDHLILKLGRQRL